MLDVDILQLCNQKERCGWRVTWLSCIPLLQRYLKSATPLVSEAELVSTQKAMTEFVTGVGGKLHKEIVEREKKRYSSFITDPWFDMYLSNRDALPLNMNPQLTFHDDPIAAKNDQATRAAVLAHSTARFMRTLGLFTCISSSLLRCLQQSLKVLSMPAAA